MVHDKIISAVFEPVTAFRLFIGEGSVVSFPEKYILGDVALNLSS